MQQITTDSNSQQTKLSAYAIPGIQVKITVDFIKYQVCRVFGITKEELATRTNKRKIVEPRQTVMYFLDRYTALKLYVIGEILGGYGHSNVIHACKNVMLLRDTDKDFREKFEIIDRILSNSKK